VDCAENEHREDDEDCPHVGLRVCCTLAFDAIRIFCLCHGLSSLNFQREQSTEFCLRNRLAGGFLSLEGRGIAAVQLWGAYADLRPIAPRFPHSANLPEAVNSLRSVGRAHGLHRHPTAPPLQVQGRGCCTLAGGVQVGIKTDSGATVEHPSPPALSCPLFHDFVKPATRNMQRCGRGVLMCTVARPTEWSELTVFGQVRITRESRSDWAKVRISTPRPQRGCHRKAL